MVNKDRIINFDFQGWPVEKISFGEFLGGLGLKVNRKGVINIDPKDELLDLSIHTVEDDGMGYGVAITCVRAFISCDDKDFIITLDESGEFVTLRKLLDLVTDLKRKYIIPKNHPVLNKCIKIISPRRVEYISTEPVKDTTKDQPFLRAFKDIEDPAISIYLEDRIYPGTVLNEHTHVICFDLKLNKYLVSTQDEKDDRVYKKRHITREEAYEMYNKK